MSHGMEDVSVAEGSKRRAEGLSALRQRLPGQRTPPDPNVEQPSAADLTYGWHRETDSGDEREADRFEYHADRFDDEDELTDADSDAEAAARHHNVNGTRPAATPWGISSTRVGSSTPFWHRWSQRDDSDRTSSAQDKLNDDRTAEEAANAENSFICRICFDGPGSIGEGGESLGKLIAPCKCRGTMKFVHQRCLRRWRVTSQRQSSVMQCDQCGAPYRFKKSPFVGLATNKPLLVLMSCVLFVSLVWTVGFVAEVAVRRMDVDKASPNSFQEGDSKTKSWWPFGGDNKDSTRRASTTSRSRLYQDINLDRSGYDSDDVYADSFFDYRYDYRYVYSEPAAYVTLIKAAVKYVGSGQAFKHLFHEAEEGADLVAVEAERTSSDQLGWWATLKDDWLYGKGGLREGQRPIQDAPVIAADEANTMLPSSESSIGSESTLHTETDQRKRYDALKAREVEAGEKVTRPVARRRHSRRKQGPEEQKAGWLERLTLQLSLGASLVGMSSFLSILLGISTWAPFHLNLGLGRGFARFARRRGGGGRGGGGGGGGGASEGEALVAVFLLFLVIVGIIRALFAVYRLTTYISRRLLTRVEDIILDWGHDEDQGQQEQRQTGVRQEMDEQDAQRQRMHERLDAALER